MKKNDIATGGDDGKSTIILIVGKRGTGKSTIARQLTNHHQNMVVVESDMFSTAWNDLKPLNTTGGCMGIGRRGRYRAQIDVNRPDDFFRGCFEGYYNGTLLLEDARTYLTAQTAGYLKRLVIRSRIKWVNIIVVCHSWMEVPPVFFSYTDYLVLFPTTSSIDRRKSDITEFQKWKELTEYVNKTGNMRIERL